MFAVPGLSRRGHNTRSATWRSLLPDSYLGVEGCGTSDVVALGEVDPVRAQELQRFSVLNAFGDRFLTEALGEIDYRFDQVLVCRVVLEVVHELDVDLEVPDRKLLEVGETAEAG